MNLKRLALALGVAVFAPVVALQAMSNAELPVPSSVYSWNGFNKANLALARLEVGEVDSRGMPEFSVRDPGPQLAREAFSAEPLASDALFVLAVERQTIDGAENARGFVALASQLEQRNRYLGLLRLQEAMADADIDAAFAVLDQFTLVRPETAEAMAAAMSPLVADPALRSQIGEALERDPVWGPTFWMQAPRNQAAVAGLLALRTQVDAGTSQASDENLLSAAVRAGFYTEALTQWGAMTDAPASSIAYLPGEEYAPIGWQFEKTARRSMNVLSSGGYSVVLDGNASGEIGRQLVRLPAGNYVLELEGDRSLLANMQSALTCVDSEASPIWQDVGPMTSFAVDGTCRTYWLMLSADNYEQRSDLRGTITSIDFRAAN